MKQQKYLIVSALFLSGLLVTGCAFSLALPSMNDLEKRGSLPAKVDRDSFEKGRQLMAASCRDCHQLIAPQQLSAPTWEAALPNMADRSGLGEEDLEDLRTYVFTVRKVLNKE